MPRRARPHYDFWSGNRQREGNTRLKVIEGKREMKRGESKRERGREGRESERASGSGYKCLFASEGRKHVVLSLAFFHVYSFRFRAD